MATLTNSCGEPILTSIAFADEKVYLPLQAADLFSWVVRAEALYRYHRQEYSLRELYDEFAIRDTDTRLGVVSPFWDKQHLEEFSEGVLRRLKARKEKPSK